LFPWIAKRIEELRKAREGGFTLIELLVVVTIIGILAAIAIPTYVGQQDEAKDAAAKAQLRTAATSQQLYYARHDEYADNVPDLEAYGFRQGDQAVTVEAASASTYCMQAPGGSGTFKITEDTGSPESGSC
jgi:type IV pilus assembly protein PilA